MQHHGSVSSELELNYDNASNTSIQICRNQVGIDATLSPFFHFVEISAINLITEGGINRWQRRSNSLALVNKAAYGWIGTRL
jgi:hypothetical protein